MDEQVADGDLARYPRVVHAKPKHMVDNRSVPPDLALVDEDGERSGGHRLAGRAGLEQGLSIDRRRVDEPARPPATREGGLAGLEERDRQPDRADLLPQRLDAFADVARRVGKDG